MEDRPLQSSWLASEQHFGALQEFVSTSAAGRPPGDQGYRENLYCSWVLLTYAAMQGAINDQGGACVTILGRAAGRPHDLPPHLRREHHRRTLDFLASCASGRLPAVTDQMFHAALSSIDRNDWSEHTRLLVLERNVWPEVVRSWLGRLGSEHKLGWIDAPVGDSSETLGSQIARLVDERNRFAHGERPVTMLEAEIMCDWIAAARLFVERVTRTVQEWTIRTFPTLPYPELGEIDRAVSERLGECTLAFSHMAVPLSTRDVVCIWNTATPVFARVVSMQSDGAGVAAVAEGHERLAVTFGRKVQPDSRIHCLP